jgi:Predicted membrane protein
MEWFFVVMQQKYATLAGRARRKEYWMFTLVSTCIYIVFVVLGKMLKMNLEGLWHLATMLPTISVGVRRMHDMDKSGWFLLVPVYNLYLLCQPGTEGPNRFGDDPKGTPPVPMHPMNRVG